MEILCPKCGDENCFHNGVSYECPECNHEWGFLDEMFNEDEDELYELYSEELEDDAQNKLLKK